MKFSLIVLSLLGLSLTQKCTDGKHAIYEWDDLPDTEKYRFIQTMKQFYATNAYAEFTDAHMANFGVWHNSAYFLPAHRCLLTEFHKALKKIDPDCPLVYWDSSLDADDMSRSPLWQYFDLRDMSSCVQDDVSSSLLLQDPNQHCLKRNYHSDGSNSKQVAASVLGEMIRSAPDYATFASDIEYKPHPLVHFFIGGSDNPFSDMGVAFSPNDPVFWLHHCWIDKLWYNFQQLSPKNQNDFGGKDANGKAVKKTDKLAVCNLPVSDFMSMDDLCYTYMPPGSKYVGKQIGGTPPAPPTAPPALPPAQPPAVATITTTAKTTSVKGTVEATRVTAAKTTTALPTATTTDVQPTYTGQVLPTATLPVLPTVTLGGNVTAANVTVYANTTTVITPEKPKFYNPHVDLKPKKQRIAYEKSTLPPLPPPLTPLLCQKLGLNPNVSQQIHQQFQSKQKECEQKIQKGEPVYGSDFGKDGKVLNNDSTVKDAYTKGKAEVEATSYSGAQSLMTGLSGLVAVGVFFLL